MSFFYPFMNFFQPGIFWPQLAPLMPMLVLGVLCIVGGMAKASSYPRKEAFKHPIFFWLMAFVLLQPVSVLQYGISIALKEFLWWCGHMLFLIASVFLITDEQKLKRYVWGVLTGSMFIVVFGIAAVLGHWPEAVGGRAGAYGMYENHNDYSFIIIQIFPFLYMYRKVVQGKAARLLLVLSLAACVAGIMMSLSRGGMLTLVLECALIILIGMDGKKRMLWLVPLAFVGAMAIALQWSARASNQGSSYTSADAKNSRYELWSAGAQMVADHPFLGVGRGYFYDYAKDYGEISADNVGKNSHNTYIEIVTGNGLTGLFIFLAFIWSMIRFLRKPAFPQCSPLLDATRRATLIAFYSILFRSMLDVKYYDWSFYVLCTIGLTCTVLQRYQSNPGTKHAVETSAAKKPQTVRYDNTRLYR